MKKTTLYRSLFFTVAFCGFVAFESSAQIKFANSNSLTPTASHSGCAVSVVDVNNDGLDDIVKMDQSNTLVVELQNKNGSFTHYNLGNISGTSKVWGMALADVDHNGWKDVVTGTGGSGGSVYLIKLSWTGTTIAAAISTLPRNFFVQNITFGDFNNDGWVDLFVCDDINYAKIYVNNAGSLDSTTTLINTNINAGLTVGGDPYDSGNYGSVWTDFDNDGDLDLYIAHCRQSATSNTDQRRRDRLFVNNGSNIYSEQAQSYGIEVTDFKQTWTTSFGDIDNDGDMDIVMTNHGENGQILQNDGTGHFTDITAGSGFTTPGTDPIESTVEDFDNDGFLDILISGGGPGDSYFLYHNNGNNTFTLVPSPFPSTTNGMLSFATGDLNHDGKTDVFASYGGVYNNPSTTADVLYLNTTKNTNHFITFNLTGKESNIGAIGARATIYGPWGKQIREVRAGESYGTSNSMQLRFGLGQHTTVDSARIDWPSHLQTHFTNLAADQFVTVIEDSCFITGNIIPGPYIFCTGQNLNLTTGAGFLTYAWSNGDFTQSTLITTPGMYNVEVTNINGCSNISASVDVKLNPDETPMVSVTGDLVFCSGGLTTLHSSPASSYLWSSGQTTQSISVSNSGTYKVTVQGLCASFTSDSISVNVLAAPLSVVSDDSAHGPIASITLHATGNSISWYDQQNGGTLLGTGASFTTPPISITTTYWVENSSSYGGSNDFTGQHYHSGTSLYNNGINGGLDFNVMAACTLTSVKVYTESTHYGTRQIQLMNSGGTVIDSVNVIISADSTIVPLNFPLAVGSNYRITTSDALDNANFGVASPFLQRSSNGVNYPYSVNGKVSITNGWTGSATSSSAYYYFYDWNITTSPTICVSSRIPVHAIILSSIGINTFTVDNHLHVFPNPANENVTVSFDMPGAATARVEFTDAIGRVVYTRTMESSGGSFNQVFNVGNFSKGIYTMHVSSQDKTTYQQLVIQ